MQERQVEESVDCSVQVTPRRGGSERTSSSALQVHLDDLNEYLCVALASFSLPHADASSAQESYDSIRTDLKGVKECDAVDMIKFLLAFCLSDGAKVSPTCDERILVHAFEEARTLANLDGTPLKQGFSALCVVPSLFSGAQN